VRKKPPKHMDEYIHPAQILITFIHELAHNLDPHVPEGGDAHSDSFFTVFYYLAYAWERVFGGVLGLEQHETNLPRVGGEIVPRANLMRTFQDRSVARFPDDDFGEFSDYWDRPDDFFKPPDDDQAPKDRYWDDEEPLVTIRIVYDDSDEEKEPSRGSKRALELHLSEESSSSDEFEYSNVPLRDRLRRRNPKKQKTQPKD
jgi:hypothetical protein